MLLLASTAARGADQLSLISGRNIDGKVSFDAKGNNLLVLPKGQPSQTIAITDVLSLRMEARPEKRARRAVVLVNGAVLAADQILSVSEREARIKRTDATLLTVPTALVATILYDPAGKLAAPPGTFAGVQTRAGDLSEGIITQINEQHVSISSVLFGIQELDVNKTVYAVHFRPVEPTKAGFIIRTVDGSTYMANGLTVDAGKLVMQTELVGTISVSGDTVRTIDLGPAAADPLTQFIPARPDGTVLLRPEETRSIAVDQKYRALLVTLSVPREYLPTRTVRFIITADGKEIAKTDPMTSLDATKSFTLPIDNAKQITFRLDVTGPASLGTAGAITDARLVRK